MIWAPGRYRQKRGGDLVHELDWMQDIISHGSEVIGTNVNWNQEKERSMK